ncbi:MAG: hypothetical protein R8M45_04265 [Ghiorsea sp.]
MAEQDVESVNAEKEAILDASSAKKSRWKLYLTLLLLVGTSAWYVWTYVPAVQQFRHNLLGNSVVVAVKSTPVDARTFLISPATPNPPLFEDKAILPEVQVEVDQPVAAPDVSALAAHGLIQGDVSSQMMLDIQGLQGQLGKLQQRMVAMQNQQVQQLQMQVRVQLFQLLATASSANKSTHDVAVAWKSITLLPMLTDDKREYAAQAYAALLLLQEDKQVILYELEQLQIGLGMQLVEVDVASPQVPSEVQPVAAGSWSDWLAAQFHFSKVEQGSKSFAQALRASQADVRSMLRQARQALHGEQWRMVPDLGLLVHKLNQQGIETSLSVDMVEAWQQGKQDWQAQAQAWMEQL